LVIRAVVCDVGETLVDESTEYGAWADWLEVPRHTFSARFGGVIALGGDYRDVFKKIRSDFDLDVERARRTEAGVPETFGADDLYYDARSALRRLRDEGMWVGVAGNQTSRAGEILRGLELPADMIATSADWGAAKPDPAFFEQLVAAAPYGASEICYVGDRLDWDIRPATAAGLRTAWIKRGPWQVLRDDEAEAMATFHLDSLLDLPARIAEFNAAH
jgi:HAD superfamily hydrolase (TIGR01549 family)